MILELREREHFYAEKMAEETGGSTTERTLCPLNEGPGWVENHTTNAYDTAWNISAKEL